jgi:hypothetical protein
MTQVLHFLLDSKTASTRVLNLDNSTVGEAYGKVMTFCYYFELDAQTVIAALKPKKEEILQKFCVFIKLVNGEPVCLHERELWECLEQHGEFIPDDI